MKYYFTFFFLLVLLSCSKDDDQAGTNSGSTPSTAFFGLIQDEIDNVPIVVVGSAFNELMIAFKRTTSDGAVLEFSYLSAALPDIMSDNEGNTWNIFGYATDGPRKGEQLQSANGYFGLWFSWAAMFPNVEIYGEPAIIDTSISIVQNNPDWNISTMNVFTILGQDAIPSIDEPLFEVYENSFLSGDNEEFYLDDNDIVIGLFYDNRVKLYPQRILNWHEVVNDKIGGKEIAVSFCPLTATSVAWDRNIDGNVLEFGVSGLLYNSNVIVYDRGTETLWSQMREKAVSGALIDIPLSVIPTVEATWNTWKINYPNAPMLTTDTGFGKDYTINPYKSYLETENVLSYPVDYTDDRLPLKEKVYGVNINGNVKVYQFKDLEK